MISCTSGPDGAPCGRATRGPLQPGECPRCHISLNRDQLDRLHGEYLSSRSLAKAGSKRSLPVVQPCIHIGKPSSPTEGKDVRKRYHECEAGRGIVSTCGCNKSCPDYQPELPLVITSKRSFDPKPRRSDMEWAYGVMTCKARLTTLLPRTLDSLREGGFDAPRLFVDGCREADIPSSLASYEVTCRYPKILLHGNWTLALLELYTRQPHADRYAIFQDDLVCSTNLRAYLESIPYPDDAYWNLYTCRGNENGGKNYQDGTGFTGPFTGVPKDSSNKPIDGWYPSNQWGWGALGIVFDRKALVSMVTSEHMASRPTHPTRGWKAIDGGIVDSMKKAGRHERVHYPSLVQHTGKTSAMDKYEPSDGKDDDFREYTWADGHWIAFSDSFRGEGYDLISLVQK